MSSFNSQIETAFQNFAVNGVSIPVSFMYYFGHGEPYVVYSGVDADNVLTGDNEILGYVSYYDFDVYAKGNYEDICDAVIDICESIGFMWQPSQSSSDMYEEDTGYYHKTLNFAKEKGV